MGLVKLDGAIDHVAAAVPSDAIVHGHPIIPAIVRVWIDVLLHLKEASTFRGLLNVRDHIMKLPDRALATPFLKRFFGWDRADNCFECCYTVAVRKTVLALVRLKCIDIDTMKHDLGYGVDDVRPAAQAMTLRMDVQTVAIQTCYLVVASHRTGQTDRATSTRRVSRITCHVNASDIQ
jgi:hypothetical protein